MTIWHGNPKDFYGAGAPEVYTNKIYLRTRREPGLDPNSGQPILDSFLKKKMIVGNLYRVVNLIHVFNQHATGNNSWYLKDKSIKTNEGFVFIDFVHDCDITGIYIRKPMIKILYKGEIKYALLYRTHYEEVK